MPSETSVADKRYVVLHYSVFIIAYSQQVFGMKGMFGTKANITKGIIILFKRVSQIEVEYGLLNVTQYVRCTLLLYLGLGVRQNLSSGFPTKRDSNQPPQLQRRL